MGRGRKEKDLEKTPHRSHPGYGIQQNYGKFNRLKKYREIDCCKIGKTFGDLGECHAFVRAWQGGPPKKCANFETSSSPFLVVVATPLFATRDMRKREGENKEKEEKKESIETTTVVLE